MYNHKTNSTMRKLHQMALLLVGMLAVTATTAQKAETPNNTYDLGATINEMTLTVGGVLVAATNNGLVGIDAKQNTPIFSFNNFGKLSPEETDFIPASPYIVVSQGANN